MAKEKQNNVVEIANLLRANGVGLAEDASRAMVFDQARRFVPSLLLIEQRDGQFPTVNGEHLPLYQLVQEAVRAADGCRSISFDPWPYPFMKAVGWHFYAGEAGKEMADMIWRLPGVVPPQRVLSDMVLWLPYMEQKYKLVVHSTICPDYGKGTGPDGTPVYTFDGLGDGIGIVAARLLSGLPAVARFAKMRGLDLEVIISGADFEFESEEVYRRVGLTQAECLARLRRSLDKVKEAAESACPCAQVITPFITELDRRLWTKCNAQAKAMVESGRFSEINWRPSDVYQARRSLLERWYGAGVDVREKVLTDGSRYGAIGMYIDTLFPDALFLEATSVAMQPFSHMGRVRPVVFMDGHAY